MAKRNGAPVNLYLDRELVDAARELAAARNQSLSDFIEEAARAKLRAQARKEATTSRTRRVAA